jgi:hypothetical protein
MPIDERELRLHLAETAAQAEPPHFTAEDLAARVRGIRRRRRTRGGIIAAVSVAVVASAVAIPLTRGGTSQPGISAAPPSASGLSHTVTASGTSQGRESVPAPPGPALSYTVTVNGQTRAAPPGISPLFTIAPGERLTMTVEVTVPGPQAITGLWLGITNNILAPRADGPADMTVLGASTRVPLRPGVHRFVLHWTVPAGFRPGASRQLSAESAWSGPEPGEDQGEVAEFAVPLPSGATSPAAVARLLRTTALHEVKVCDGAGPASILAVRTTFSKAIATVGAGLGGVTDNATDAVYLVLMKGDFTLYNGGPVVPCAHAPTGHYFSAIIDAATFVTLQAGVGNQPPSVPLQTLGPVLNLTTAP